MMKIHESQSKGLNGMIKTNVLGDKIPKENLHSLYNYWFYYENGKKNLQVYLEECKYKSRKIKMTKFIKIELQSESESKLESDTELESKLESDSE